MREKRRERQRAFGARVDYDGFEVLCNNFGSCAMFLCSALIEPCGCADL